MTLGIDIETYSDVDLKKCGVYKYVQSPSFQVLMIAYKLDDEPIRLIDIAGGMAVPDYVHKAILNPDIIKTAFNANFERTGLAKHFDAPMPPEQWECTMVKASMMGLPISLDNASKALRLSQLKDKRGGQLIRYFCIPCKPTASNEYRTRNLPIHDMQKWEEFKGYCIQDVMVEQEIRRKLSFFPVPALEKQIWNLDQKINDRGVLLDHRLVTSAIKIDETYQQDLLREATELTQLENPNSVQQLRTWLSAAMSEDITDLKKKSIPAILQRSTSHTVTRVLEMRQEMSKTSIKKYLSMEAVIGKQNIVRGLLQYYGAGRTGRWAGRLIQVQNLPQNKYNYETLGIARNIVKSGDAELLQMLFGSVPDILSQLIRTAFLPRPGNRFITADFAAIEARVIAWLAGEQWRLDVFNTPGKDIYKSSASLMFGIPYEEITKTIRQKGKVAELALGYQGAVNALISMGALDMGLTEDELPPIVKLWRQASPAIVDLWDDVDTAARACIQRKRPTKVHCVDFRTEKGFLFIDLPSGRSLSYAQPAIGKNAFGNTCIKYLGMNQLTNKWTEQDTFGGKLVENIVQAIARDILADSMLRLDAAGYPIAMHVHDENVLDVPLNFGSTTEVNEIMGAPIPWAPGLPLKAVSFESSYYLKD